MQPSVNPVSSGCVPRGWPIEHLGRQNIWCPNCEGNGHGSSQDGELYLAARPAWMVSSYPYPPKPASKSAGRSASGLGVPGRMEQCRRCENVYLAEEDGTARWWAELDRCRVVLAASSSSPVGAPERSLLVSADAIPVDDSSMTADPQSQADWHHAAHNDIFYFLVTGWMASSNIRCGWCGRTRSTTVTHLPPLSWCGSHHEWKLVGGHLMPSCGQCHRQRAADDDWTPPGLSLRKTARNLKRARMAIINIASQAAAHIQSDRSADGVVSRPYR